MKTRLFFSFILITLLIACQKPETPDVAVEVPSTETPTATATSRPEQPTTTHTSTSTPVPTSPPDTPTPTPPPTKSLTICLAAEPDTLYLHGTSMLAQDHILHGLYENLYTNLNYDYQPQGLEKLPSLADGDARLVIVEISPGTTIIDTNGDVVTLEEGLSVQNANGETITFDGTPIEMIQMEVDFTFKPLIWEDGHPVTADDSVYSYELKSDPDQPAYDYSLYRTATYEAIDSHTVRWTGLPGFLDSTYFLNVYQPLPRHAWSHMTTSQVTESTEAQRTPLSNGPFRILHWLPGEEIELTRNENYYRAHEGLPKLDSVTIRFIPDPNQIMTNLLSGRCDISTQGGVDISQAEFLIEAQADGLLQAHFQSGTAFEHLDFGIVPIEEYAETRPDWFGDVRVRQAIAQCLDHQAIINHAAFGVATPLDAYTPNDHPLLPDDISRWPTSRDTARALLDELGYLDTDNDGIREDPLTGTPFHITLGTTSGTETRPLIVEEIQTQLLACGIEVEPYFVPAPEFFDDGPAGPIFGRQFDLVLFAWVIGTEPSCRLYLGSQIPEPDNWGGSNNTGWQNADFDTACEAALNSLPGRDTYIPNHQTALRIWTEELPSIPLFLHTKVALTTPHILNFHLDPTQPSELWNLYELDIIPKS